MKRLTYILFGVILLLSSCSGDEGSRVCGVKVHGTPWTLAASIADNGDGSFIPEQVEVYAEKAYIKGWLNTNETVEPYRVAPYDDGYIPAQLVCDVENGKVTHAWIDCEIIGIEKSDKD